MAARPLPKGLPAERRMLLANRLNSEAIHVLRRIARGEPRSGITAARLSALSVIVYGGVDSPTELARREGVSLPTMTRIVDALVAEGLVRRERVAEDRRAVRLTATARGRTAMERGRARRIRRLEAELRKLAEPELAVLEQAVGVLARLGAEEER